MGNDLKLIGTAVGAVLAVVAANFTMVHTMGSAAEARLETREAGLEARMVAQQAALEARVSTQQVALETRIARELTATREHTEKWVESLNKRIDDSKK